MAAGESAKAKEAFADYLALGTDRSLAKLAAMYQSRPKVSPTKHLSLLKRWSAQFGWTERIEAFRDEVTAARAEAGKAEELRVMQEGFALRHERVKALNRLAGKLLSELDGDRLWVSEPKMIGAGNLAREVEIERFNTAELEQFRGLLDDITKETGERVKLEKHEMVGKDGKELNFTLNILKAGALDAGDSAD